MKVGPQNSPKGGETPKETPKRQDPKASPNEGGTPNRAQMKREDLKGGEGLK